MSGAGEDDKVRRLGVRYKTPPSADGPVLKVLHHEPGQCNHDYFFARGELVNVVYQIRQGETEVECSNCGTKLDPMWVLQRLASNEHKWHHSRETYQEEMKRLSERSRTQCDHCGKMTRISRR